MALITTVVVTSIEDPSTTASVSGTHAASARADNPVARPLTLRGLAVEIDKITSAIDLTGSTTRARREAARHRHATARHAKATSHAAATPAASTTPNSAPSYTPQPPVTQAPATQQSSSTQAVAQPAGPTGSGAAFGPGY